jgi:putative nucleotidyltransferase with HDIG domain
MSAFPAGYHPLEQGLIRRVLEDSSSTGLQLYLVGGYIRDALLGKYGPGKQPLDFDFAVCGGAAIALARTLSDKLSGHFVLLDQALDTARVVLDSGEMLDFAGCVGGSIETDVTRRDFTLNALVWNPKEPEQILDLIGGMADLKELKIRAIAEKNFVDDPLRMLRAFRFSTTLDGTIEPLTRSMIRQNAALLTQSAPERINYELFAILNSKNATGVLREMGELAILEEIFPELIETRRVTPNAYHHLGLWDHSLEAVAQAEMHLTDLPTWVHEDLSVELSAGITRLQAMKLACLLHDIGKPGTWQITAEGRHSFYGHDRLGAEMCEVVAERQRWSRPVSRFIVNLIRWHLRPGQLFHQGRPTDRAVLRFYRTISADTPALMVLAFGDFGATRGPGLEGPKRDALEKDLHELLAGFSVFVKGQSAMQRLIDGNDIMQLLGIHPGPILGEILEAVAEAQGLKEIRNREQAEQFVCEYYRNKGDS